MRLFALSDIHTDYQENRNWLAAISKLEYLDDALILAGDISDALDRIEHCFEHMCCRFKKVFFVPGNHDLWVHRCGQKSSLKKLSALSILCERYAIATERTVLADTEIIPLLSWYDYTFGQPSEQLQRSWMDFHNCHWPDEFASAADVCRYFLSRNTLTPSFSKTVISFSHFVPRIDVMPFYIPPKHRIVYPVLGSKRIDEQLRQLKSDIHIYGHSHVNRDITIDGVRYINNAQGYPSETWLDKRLFCVAENL